MTLPAPMDAPPMVAAKPQLEPDRHMNAASLWSVLVEQKHQPDAEQTGAYKDVFHYVLRRPLTYRAHATQSITVISYTIS